MTNLGHEFSEALAPVLFIPHGGGPLPLLGDPSHAKLNVFLANSLQGIRRPSAIVVVSAHWEAEVATVTSGATPGLIYDYYGFPPASYQIKYPVPGAPVLAQRIHELLEQHGIAARLDDQRGFDHGVFVPLKIMQPDASIPCVQLSLLKSLDPRAHIDLGMALRKLREDNVLILGSGFSFHNLSLMSTGISREAVLRNEAFQNWLLEVCTSPAYDAESRIAKLIDWKAAPYARFCHPREEHLLPLHVCLGAATEAARCVFDDAAIGMRVCGLRW